jgi:Rod binding domain-containing protein
MINSTLTSKNYKYIIMETISNNTAISKGALLPTNALNMPVKNSAAQAALEFEAAFIAQMLQFSGLAKALTAAGGQSVESFTQFYIEELAKDITNNGGFGIADKISAYIKTKEETYGELGQL